MASRDDYLAYALEQEMLKALRQISTSDCQRTQDLALGQLTLAAQSEDGMSYLNLGNNTYGVLYGETLHTFRCKEVRVTPRVPNCCSKELPISYKGQSKYLQPISRIIIQHPSLVPCSSLMAGKFETLKGEWIAATPRLQITSPPQPLHQQDATGININHTDMSQGGIYTQDQVEEFSKLLNFPKVRQAIKHQVITDLCDQNDHYLCHNLKDTMGTPGEETTIFNFGQHLKTYLHTIGETTSIMIAIWMIIQMIIGLSKLAINAINLRGVTGLRRIGQLLCPTVIINYDYGKLTRAARRRQQEGKKEPKEESRSETPEDGPTTSSQGEADSTSHVEAT